MKKYKIVLKDSEIIEDLVCLAKGEELPFTHQLTNKQMANLGATVNILKNNHELLEYLSLNLEGAVLEVKEEEFRRLNDLGIVDSFEEVETLDTPENGKGV